MTASRVATTPEVMILSLVRDEKVPSVPVDVEEEIEFPDLAAMRLVAVIYRSRRNDGSASYSCACRGPMDAFWYFEEGRAPEAIKRSVSHVKPKHVYMVMYERVVKWGKRPKRSASGRQGSGPSRGGKAGQLKQQGTESAPRSGQEEFQGVPGMWTAPRRELKRYPSWVDALQIENMRRRRIEGLVERAVDAFFRENGVEEGGDALADAIMEAWEAEADTNERLAFCMACSLRTLQRIRGQSENADLVSLCSQAYGEYLVHARMQIGGAPDLRVIFADFLGDIEEVEEEEEGDVGKSVDQDLLREYGAMVTDFFREFGKCGKDVGSLPKLKAALQLEARALDGKHQHDEKSCEVRQAVLRACAARHEQLRTLSSVSLQESSFFAMAGETLREEAANIEREQQRSSAAVDADLTGTASSGSLGTGAAALDIVDLVEEDANGVAGGVDADTVVSTRLSQEAPKQSDTVDAVVAAGKGRKRASVSADVRPVRRSARVAARTTRTEEPATSEVQVQLKRRRK